MKVRKRKAFRFCPTSPKSAQSPPARPIPAAPAGNAADTCRCTVESAPQRHPHPKFPIPCPTGDRPRKRRRIETRGDGRGADLRSPSPSRFRSDQLRGRHGERLHVPGGPPRHRPPAARRLPPIRLLQRKPSPTPFAAPMISCSASARVSWPGSEPGSENPLPAFS